MYNFDFQIFLRDILELIFTRNNQYFKISPSPSNNAHLTPYVINVERICICSDELVVEETKDIKKI